MDRKLPHKLYVFATFFLGALVGFLVGLMT